MIETRLLRQFVAVAEELHFHKAAARLHMAQPPLSQAIGRLEDKLGFSLFLRNKRGVRLTAAGTAFLDTAYRTLAELEQGIEYARNVLETFTVQELETTRVSARDGRTFTVAWALLHALEHTTLHLGQIQLTRQLWEQAKR